MAVPYTLGMWQVEPGREEDFVERWRELAEWTRAEVAPEATAVLLRDTEDRSRFVSVGPWSDLGQIERWRESAGFQERVRELLPLLQSFEPNTLELVVEIG